MTSQRQLLYIIGAPRSGTTFLQILLGEHPQVATTVELSIFNQYVAPLQKAWTEEAEQIRQKKWDQGQPFIWSKQEFDDFLRTFIEASYAKVAALKPAATHILDKQPNYSFHIHDLKRLVPQARFIHVIRDGRDVAVSMMAARRRMGFGTATLADSAKAWKDYLEKAREAARYGGDYLEVRYENLLANGVDAYAKVLEFCGLPFDRAELARAIEENSFDKMKSRQKAADQRVTLNSQHYYKGKAGSWQEEFSAQDCYDFERIAGPLLRELGYAQGDWWVKHPLARLSGPVRHFLRVRRHYAAIALIELARAILGDAITQKVFPSKED